jgi:hypothetical protein
MKPSPRHSPASRLLKSGRKMVGVEDLHFHDMRHAGVSWLFDKE